MKANQRIEVRVSPEGAISVEAVGYTGKTCEEATAFLEQALGTVARRQRNRDWYRRTANANTATHTNLNHQ